MKIKNQINILLIGAIGLVTVIFLIGLLFMNINMSSKQKDISQKVNCRIDDDVTKQLFDLGENISNYEISIESEVDKNMLNAANAVKEADEKSSFNLTANDVQKIKEETGMNDIYLTTPDGVFTNLSTEKNADGLSLYDIWDGYKTLMTGESACLPSSLKIKAETGEIFKFTAIPRADGKGIIESAMESNNIEEYMQSFLSEKNGVKAMYLIDSSGLVLTENLYKDYQSVLTKGSAVNIEEVNNIIKGTSEKNIVMGDNKAELYMPVVSGGSVKYALYLVVDTSSYYDMADTVNKPLDELQGNIVKITIMILICVIISVIASILVGGTLSSKLFKPLSYFKDTLNNLAQGKEVSVKKNSGSSDFIELNDSLNKLVTRYTQIIDNIKNNAKKIKTLQDDYYKKIDDIVKVANEANDNMNNNVYRIEKQNDNIHDITSILEEMMNTISEINNESQVLLNKTSDSNGIAKEGVSSLNNMSKSFDVISNEITESSNIIGKLSESSSKIADITNIISDISEQTNLLSLNASIEAARVGEQGKGFLVVANEIKDLATQSSEATNTITSLVKEILQNIQDTESSNKTQIDSINNSKEMMNDTKNQISKLVNLTIEIGNMIGNLSNEVNNVFNSSNNVNSGVETLNEYSTENTNDSKATKESMNVVIDTLNLLQKSLDEISANIQELNNNI